MKRAFTLIELSVTITMLLVLMGSAVFVFTVALKAWGNQDTALEIREDLHQGLERALRDLRPATEVLASDDSIRYRVREGGADNRYIFYLYHPSDPWGGAYTQSVYQLRRATFTSTDLSAPNAFSYGSGTIYAREVKPPPTSDLSLSLSGTVITLDLTASKGDETFRLLERLRPRNL